MDIYGYHWWFPFHEIPWPPKLTHKIKFWLHSPPKPNLEIILKSKNWEKTSCSVMRSNTSLKVLKYPKTRGSLMDVFSNKSLMKHKVKGYGL
jgi:hypothetical protein